MSNTHHSTKKWLQSTGGRYALNQAIQAAYGRQTGQWLDPAQIRITRIEFHTATSGRVHVQCATQNGQRPYAASFDCHGNGLVVVQNIQPIKPSLSRRDFLKQALVLGGAALLPNSEASQTALIPLPPCIMLHSQHGVNMSRDGFFPQFLRLIQEQHYTTITFQTWLCAVLHDQPLPDKPLIISIDDMAMDRGNPSFQYFRNMHHQLALNRMVGTFGIVTRPRLQQDESRWDEVRAWVEEGFEMATHTSEHTNFNQTDSSARVDLTQDHVDAEIINSARMIQAHIDQPVSVLITPYGSGFNRLTDQIHPNIVSACQRAAIRIVVGITDGRQPIAHDHLQDPDFVLYCGRTTPGNDNPYEAIYNVNMWGLEGVQGVAEAVP